MQQDARFLPIYTEYPETQAGFLRLYQLLAQQVPWDAVAESCLHLFTNPDPSANEGLASIKAVYPDIYRALFLLAEGENRATERLARRWLRGETLTRGELKDCGFASNIDSPSDCSAAVSVLARVLALKRRLVAAASDDFRLVWILDEAQRLGNAPPRLNQEVNAGLQSTFNATPDYLTLILSFTGVPAPTLPPWLRPALADRIGARNLLLLPPFTRQQAKEFFRELLDHFHTARTADQPFFPFTNGAVDYMLARVLHGKLASLGDFAEKEGIRPRALIKYAHGVLEEHVQVEGPLPIDESFVAAVFPK